MTRADALRALIKRVEAGHEAEDSNDSFFLAEASGVSHLVFWHTMSGHWVGLAEIATMLEAPLRERGWIGPFIAPPVHEGSRWHVEWVAPGRWETDGGGPDAFAPDEAPARLLAVLRALLWEAEHG